MALTLKYASLVVLDGTEYTDESRTPIKESRDERSSVVELASGKKKKYIKSIAKKWSITWEMVPLNSTKTIDGKAGRNELRTLVQGGTAFTFTLRDGHNADETYTVFVESYSEELVHRRGEYSRWSITLDLEEQV